MVKYRLDPKNARTHPERNRNAIGKSLRELGAGRSIVVDKDGVVIGGNAVYEKALELGLETEVVHTSGDKLVVVVRDDLATGDPKRKALALADNQIALLAEWDEVKLEEILGELGDIDLDVMGFNLPVEPLKEDEAAVGELINRAEELQKKWKVKRGQVWEIPGKAGIHQVKCEDSTKNSMGKAILCVTSPPYWVGREYEQEVKIEDIRIHISEASQAINKAVVDEGRIIINTMAVHQSQWEKKSTKVALLLDWWQEELEKHGWLLRGVRIWTKHGFFVGFTAQQDLHDMNWEFLATFYKKPRKQRIIGEQWAVDGLWEIQPQTVSVNHPAPFPVDIPRRFILLYTDEGDIIYDPYLGSGTTIVAAEQEGRTCYGMEICEKYVAVTLERLAALGLKPVKRDG